MLPTRSKVSIRICSELSVIPGSMIGFDSKRSIFDSTWGSDYSETYCMTNKVVFWRLELTRHELCIRGIEQKGDLVGTAFITTALQLCGGTCQVLLRIQRVGTWCIITKKSSDNFFQSFQNTTDSLTHNKWKTCNHYKIVFLLEK